MGERDAESSRLVEKLYTRLSKTVRLEGGLPVTRAYQELRKFIEEGR